FCQHENRLDGIQLCSGIFPEINWYKRSYIAPEPVNIKFPDPIFQCFGHVFPEFRLAVIKLDNIIVIPPWCGAEFAVSGLSIPLRMFSSKGIVPAAVVGHPIQNDIHSM